MNTYATINDVKALVNDTSTTFDSLLIDILEGVSRAIDDHAGRHFYVMEETRFYGTKAKIRDGYVRLEDDVLVVTTLTADSEGDWTFDGESWTEAIDFVLAPDNKFPKWGFWVHPSGSFSAAKGQRRYFKIVGDFGFGNGLKATPTESITPTITASNGTTTALTSSAAGVKAGDTLKVADEQIFVSAVASDNTSLTCTRGVNGTTGATHSAVSATKYLYPKRISQAASALAWQYWNTAPKMGVRNELFGAHQYVLSSQQEAKDALSRLVGPYVAPWAIV